MRDAEPALWMALPFIALVVLIATGPTLFPRWWERNYAAVSCLLAVLTAGVCLAAYDGAPLHRLSQVSWRTAAALREYFSFITLIGSLFVVSGGIRFQTRRVATPATNTLFLLVGAILANLFGTTGASMLLIRPWLNMNRGRSAPHQTAFFIFIIANVGGGLTPIGDPPLLVGWLRGVPFWWVAVHGWAVWLVAMAVLLAVFFGLDCRSFRKERAGGTENVMRRDAKPGRVRVREEHCPASGEAQSDGGEPPEVEGWPNFLWAVVILGAVFCPRPAFLREAIMVAAAAGSYFTTRREIRDANEFSFQPLTEVVFVFLGIFVTMMPALDWIELHASSLGAPGPTFLYWGSGILSSGLDSVPAYLAFFGPCLSGVADQAVVAHAQSGSPDHIRLAILLGDGALGRSLLALNFGSVLFGANTYIGNAPNFMVKTIAEKHGAAVPTFLGYIFKFALPFMLPTLVLVWWLFFEG